MMIAPPPIQNRRTGPTGERDRRLAHVVTRRQQATARRRAMGNPATAIPLIDQQIATIQQRQQIRRVRRQLDAAARSVIARIANTQGTKP